MATVRALLGLISDYVDFNTAHYIASSIILPLKGDGNYHFSTMTDSDIRNEIYIGLGKGLSTFENGSIKTVHATLPREFVTKEMEAYRDYRDPAMYKFHLPERVFNTILQEHPVDVDQMLEIALEQHMSRQNHTICEED